MSFVFPNEDIFKIRLLSVQETTIKVRVTTPANSSITICFLREKGFRIIKEDKEWIFRPFLKNGALTFRIEERKPDRIEMLKDCCAKCAGGFEACGLCVCCELNGNFCCDSGSCCSPCKPRR